MNFAKFAVEKKYVILALMIGIAIFGFYSRATMSTQLAPDTNPPMVTVMSTYPGAAAEDVASDVSQLLEEAFVTLEGITDVKSTSQDNLSVIQLTFDYSTDVNQAAIDVQNTISRHRGDLPTGLNEPQVLKFSTTDMPVMTIGLQSQSLDMLDLRQLAENKLVYDLQLVEGVAAVDLIGGYQQQVRVALDSNRIKAYNLTLAQVSQTIATSNVKAPGGQIVHQGKDLLLRVEESATSLSDLKQIQVPLADGNVVPLGNIATISLSAETGDSAYRLNGQEALGLLITKKADHNTVEVISNVTNQLEKLRADYPFVQLQVAADDSVFTKQMVKNMTESVAIAILLTIILIFLFITNISRSLVVFISMPMVYLSTLSLMKAFGMGLDLVTLSALILSIGFVVDTSIIVVENISDHYAKGKTIIKAAIEGTQEVGLPIMAGVSTTLIVLVPLLFVKGFVGEMFRPLSLTLIFAISSSLIVALLIIPLLSVLFEPLQLEKLEQKALKITRPFNNMMDSLKEWYVRLTKKVLRNKLKATAILLTCLAASGLFLVVNGLEMLPKFDSGVSFATIEMEPGTTLDDTSTALGQIEDFLAAESEVLSYDTRIGFEEGSSQMGDFGMMGTDQGLLTITLSSRKERKESIWEFQNRLREKIEAVPSVNRFVVKEKGGTAVSNASAPIELKISGENLDVLYSLATKLKADVDTIDGVENLYTSYNNGYSQMTIKFNNSRLKQLGLSSQNISQQLYSNIEGLDTSTITLDNNLLDINVDYDADKNLTRLLATEIMTPRGLKLPLREVAKLEVVPRSNLIERDNLEYSVKLLGFTQDRAFSHVVKDIQDLIDETPLPKGYTIGFTGEFETLTESIGDMAFLMALAVIFVYLLLVPQFQSFVHPLTIMMALPLAIIGVAPALGLTGKYMSMPVLLGFILLAGTVVNDSILLVAAINDNRKQGAELEAAIIAAIRSRYRPIMMTTLSDVVGMLPLALQLALGSERFSPMAITVIGGILAATMLTLVVIPLIYASFESLKEKLFSKATSQNKVATKLL